MLVNTGKGGMKYKARSTHNFRGITASGRSTRCYFSG